MRLRLLTLVTLLVATLGTLSPAQADAAAPAAPKVGQCHQLSWSRAAGSYSDSKAPVACSKRHDLQTLAVVTSPVSLAGMTEDQLSDAEAACFRPYWKAMGPLVRLRQTAYSLFTFVPTAAERAAGARWIRCDVALVHSAGRLASLARHRLRSPVVHRRIDDSIRLCLTARGHYATICDQPHRFRSTKAFRLNQAAYPTSDQASAAARKRCRSTTSYLTWPSEEQWTRGNHIVVCYDRTKK
jgi:hypothetical protein